MRSDVAMDARSEQDLTPYRHFSRAEWAAKRDGLAVSTDGCLSWTHSALWGALGLVVEKIA